MALKETLGYNPYKDLKTSAYSNIEFTFQNASKEFQEWFKKNYPDQDYDSFYSEEKRRIRNLFDTVQKQAANKLLREKKFATIMIGQVTKNLVNGVMNIFFFLTEKNLGE